MPFWYLTGEPARFAEESAMPALRDDIDPDGLLEYSVVFTDRSLNSMSAAFVSVMQDISAMMKEVYQAHSLAVVPGGGTYGMEAIARQFADDADCLVIRNGWFSYRWTQIFDACGMANSAEILAARQISEDPQAPFAPVPIEEAEAKIAEMRPGVVFCPHVETSAGLMLPDSYITRLAAAVHKVGGLLVLDCVASGTVFVDMQKTGVDVLLSAPQKGWTSSPCAALVMLSERARKAIEATQSKSFANDLKKWLQIMETYEAGNHAYHATMPTDALRQFRDRLVETREIGFETIRQAQIELGRKARQLIRDNGYESVAAEGFQAPSVIVSYTGDPEIKSGKKFAAAGMQIAAGVPLECGEPEGFSTFRIGLFGLDKLTQPDRTLTHLAAALERVRGQNN
jgi:aspartate aminotransferase-like enzyme